MLLVKQMGDTGVRLQEARKHRRLLKRSNKLSVDDLLEIAHMRGLEAQRPAAAAAEAAPAAAAAADAANPGAVGAPGAPAAEPPGPPDGGALPAEAAPQEDEM